MKRRSVVPGETIYHEGETSDFVYLVVSGRVSMIHRGVTVEADEGALIGFSPLFDRPYGSTAKAMTDAVLLEFTRDEIRDLIRSNPEEGVTIVEAIIDLLGKVYDAVEGRIPG